MKTISIIAEQGYSTEKSHPYASRTWAIIAEKSDIARLDEKGLFAFLGKPIPYKILRNVHIEQIKRDEYSILQLRAEITIDASEVIVQKTAEYTLLGQVIDSTAWIVKRKAT